MQVPGKNVLFLEAPPVDLRIGLIEKGDQSVPRQFSNHPVIDLVYPFETFQMILPLFDALQSLNGFTGVKTRTSETDVCVKTLFGIQTADVNPFQGTMNQESFLDLKKKVAGRVSHLAVFCMSFTDIDTFMRFIVFAEEKRFVIMRASTCWHHETLVRSWPISSEALIKEIHGHLPV